MIITNIIIIHIIYRHIVRMICLVLFALLWSCCFIMLHCLSWIVVFLIFRPCCPILCISLAIFTMFSSFGAIWGEVSCSELASHRRGVIGLLRLPVALLPRLRPPWCPPCPWGYEDLLQLAVAWRRWGPYVGNPRAVPGGFHTERSPMPGGGAHGSHDYSSWICHPFTKVGHPWGSWASHSKCLHMSGPCTPKKGQN